MVAALAAAAVLALAAFWFLRQNRASPDAAARAYLEAWQESDFETMEQMLFRQVRDFAEAHEGVGEELDARGVSFELGEVTRDGPAARAAFDVTWDLGGAGRWSYGGAMDLELREERWLVVWSPQVIHPNLQTAGALRRSRTWPDRGRILAVDGRPIAEQRRVVVIGIEPRRVTDRAAMVQALVDNLGSDPARINALLDQPGLRPDWFLPVEEITAERYEQIRPVIYPVPGLVFQNQLRRSAGGIAQHVVGTTGEITREVLDRLGAPYEVGDLVGLTGLEAVFEETLAGKPTIEIIAVDGDGGSEVLHRVEGASGQDVRTTLSIEAQAAAEAALEGVNKPAAIVVLDAPTSQIRAVVSRPLGEFNRALSGRYPPGSSFKIVTTAALLTSGVSVEQPVACPATVDAGGRSFRNFESQALGQVNFRTAFVQSCNTAFIGLASSLDESQLAEAARTFGFGARYDLPLNAASGSFPDPRDATERAAAAIGQGRVLASPLHMASVAAAVSASGWRPPTLLVDTPSVNANPIDPQVAGTLQDLTAAVVREGTGVGAAVPGRQVGGKTGTAEFGQEVPPKTHAWFVGYSGSSAFAVLVEDGGVGGEVAAPIAAKLVAGL